MPAKTPDVQLADMHTGGILLDPVIGWIADCTCGWNRFQDTEALARNLLHVHQRDVEQAGGIAVMSDYDIYNQRLAQAEKE